MTAHAKNVAPAAKRPKTIAEPTLEAGFARALVDLAVAKGAPEAALLARSGLTTRDLADSDNRIPLAKYVALMRAGKALSGDPALALHFGEAFDISELSIVGLLGQGCETVGEAFKQLNRFSRLAIEVDADAGGARLTLARDEDGTWMVDNRKNPNDVPEITESSFARMMCTSRRLGAAGLIKAVHMTHDEPPYRAEYDRIFQVPLVFGSDRNALLMGNDDGWMNQRLALQSRYVFGVLSERAEALLKRLEQSKTLRGRVEALLMPILHTGETGMERIARELGLSQRTLARRLKDEGLVFEKVLDDLRHKLAVYYLSEKKVSVNETAYLVGFSERAAFARAYKRWTGASPGARAVERKGNQH